MEGKSTEQQRVFHVRRHWRGRPSEIPDTWGHQGWLALPGQLAQWCPRQPEPDTPPLAPSTGPSTALRSGRLWSTRTAPRHTQINQHRTCKCRCVHGRDCTCSMHSPTHTHQTGHPVRPCLQPTRDTPCGPVRSPTHTFTNPPSQAHTPHPPHPPTCPPTRSHTLTQTYAPPNTWNARITMASGCHGSMLRAARTRVARSVPDRTCMRLDRGVRGGRGPLCPSHVHCMESVVAAGPTTRVSHPQGGCTKGT